MGLESSNPFLRESWERTVHHEKGEDPLDKALGVYIRIEQTAEKHSEFQEFKEALDGAVLDYLSSVNALARHWAEAGADPKETERSDQRRRFAHEALVSTINAFSRNLYRKGLDNEWMKDIVQNRDTVARWARQVASFIEGQQVPQEEEEVQII